MSDLDKAISDLDNHVFVLFRKQADNLGNKQVIYPTFAAAKKQAELDGGFIVRAYKVEKKPIIKKRKETKSGQKKPTATLVLDDPTAVVE